MDRRSLLILSLLFHSLLLRATPASSTRLLPSTTTLEAHGYFTSTTFHACPCKVKFSLRSTGLGDMNTVDLLVIRQEDWLTASRSGRPHLNDIRAVERYSLRHVSRTSTVMHDTPLHSLFSPDFRINEEGAFAVVVKPSTGHGPFASDISVSLHPLSRLRCDVVLGDRNLLTKPGTMLMNPPSRDGSPSVNVQRETDSSFAPRIVGGTNGGDFERSFMVSILSRDGLCSGSLIARNWVVTAAHCFVNEQSTVRVGGEEVMEGVLIPIRRVFMHELWADNENGRKFDITLIELALDAPRNALTLLVNVNEEEPQDSAAVRALGYGRVASGVDEGIGRLRFVDVPVTSHSRCAAAYSALIDIDDDFQICAGFENGGCDSCQGDSGGPLIQFTLDNRAVLVGIVSTGQGCAEADFPGIYTRVSQFIPWMVEQGAEFERASNIRSVFLDPIRESRVSSGAIIAIASTAGVLASVAVVLLILIVMKERKYVRGSSQQDSTSNDTASMNPPGVSTTSTTSATQSHRQHMPSVAQPFLDAEDSPGTSVAMATDNTQNYTSTSL